MVEIKNREILINGEPRLLLSGEIHYFRLKREEWQERLDQLKEAGCNAVSSYIPWIAHEQEEGECDLEGKTRPELDIAGFIDLCRENGLMFLARPGPFCMAELKNEGLPHWLLEKHPDISSVGWDGVPVPRIINYMSPAFLAETRGWYEKVMKMIAPRTAARGGNVIGVQLDNEIGMHQWLGNAPDLTDDMLADFSVWLKNRYSAETLAARYPFDPDNEAGRAAAIRSPGAAYASALMRDLGHYMRGRFANYVATLRSYAEEFGVEGVPFIVNIHGTGGGRGTQFPIGISQLYEAYTQGKGYLSGSDIYLNNLTMDNFHDLYLLNAFMAAVHDKDQPITSMEFQCGDGNYGQNRSNRIEPHSTEQKIRMCIAQGMRWLNYYVFTGGRNFRLEKPRKDGNDRIAHTGEHHGFSAFITPEGKKSHTFDRLARVTVMMKEMEAKVATMKEEHDNLSIAFIPDYYMTEYRYPGNNKMNEIARNLESNRGPWAWDMMAKAILLAGFRFGAIDVQNRPLDSATTPVLVLPSARYMDAALQKKLTGWLHEGGKLLLYGEVPQYDMEGNPCSVLADALGVRYDGTYVSQPGFYPSVVAEGWAAPRPETRSAFTHSYRSNTAAAFLRPYGDDAMCGFEVGVGKGKAIAITTTYICDPDFYKAALARLGAKPALQHDCEIDGIFMTSTSNAKDERFIHLLNLDAVDKKFNLYENGKPLFGGKELELQAHEAVMLPLNVQFNKVSIVHSTAEITEVQPKAIRFRLTQFGDEILLDTKMTCIPDSDYDIRKFKGLTKITSRKHAKVNDTLTIRFR